MLGQRLRELREERDLTQEGLAKSARISRSVIASIENRGVNDLPYTKLVAIARALKMTTEELAEALGLYSAVTPVEYPAEVQLLLDDLAVFPSHAQSKIASALRSLLSAVREASVPPAS